MPTVGWIHEQAIDAFYEGTEQFPDPPLNRGPTYPCPFCFSVFSTRSEFHEHVYATHRVERPLIMLRGQEPSAHNIVRSLLGHSDISVANTSFARVRIDGANPRVVSHSELTALMTKLEQAEIKLELVNDSERSASPLVSHYNISFRVVEQRTLKNVDKAFADILVSGPISRESIGVFLADTRTQGTGKEYASGLANYCLGILLKERPDGEKLTTPLSRYRELYGSALEVLKDFQRPLAHLITCIIRFSMNDFGDGGQRTGYWELDFATELLLDPESEALPTSFEGGNRSGVCPIDHGTGRVLQLASHLAGQPRWSPILDNECRGLTHSDLLDSSDHQKAYAIWAASALRLGSKENALEPLMQIAEVYPFNRWASKYLEQVSP